jgi:hypothetical protein
MPRPRSCRSALGLLAQLQHGATGHPVVVAPILISRGEVSNQKIPADLEGLPVVYGSTPLLPHPSMGRWVESRVRDATPR